MNHTTKILRACPAFRGHLADYPGTFEAVRREIPDDLFDSLTSRQLAGVFAVALRAHREGRDAERADILNEGAVWDGARLREVLA